MSSIVGFHQKEKDSKLFLVIQKPELSIPKITQSPTSSIEAAHLLQPLFLCPQARLQKEGLFGLRSNFPLSTSYEYVHTATRTQQDGTSVDDEHTVLPLFWCNNKEFDYFDCVVCRNSGFGTGYYFCETHGQKYHKECVESPLKIKHPYHRHHPLQLWYSWTTRECFCCGRETYLLIYCCFICNAFMHPICAMQPIPVLIEKPKRHDHPLSFFTRQTSLVCDVCGLPRKFHPTYICVRCHFVAHKDCMYFPTVIKISRHTHRISYRSYVQSKEWSCGVCRRSIDSDYGAYTCGRCSDYAVHTRCALYKDVCDGKELDGVPDKDDTTENVGPFEIISEDVIHHFLHDHHLSLEFNMLYNEKKLCQACVLPIYEGNFYSCQKCNFILHDSCANAPRMIQHALHPHPLLLKEFSKGHHTTCDACSRYFNGFCYKCSVNECTFELDVRCASISEPFEFKVHEHALFMALNPEERPTCHVCKKKCLKQLNCIKCDFIVCFKCASLPFKVRYKHDDHLLTILWGKKSCEKDWCEICECNLEDTHKAIYSCEVCSTFLHTKCLLGKRPYMKRYLNRDH